MDFLMGNGCPELYVAAKNNQSPVLYNFCRFFWKEGLTQHSFTNYSIPSR